MKTIPIEELNINRGTYNALKEAGISTANQLYKLNDKKLLAIHEIGPVRRKIIKNAIAETRGALIDLPPIDW
tara:strand:- start:848 stop:1063 length:216 start_codon:yes stop_codon:yes gene_type:complete